MEHLFSRFLVSIRWPSSEKVRHLQQKEKERSNRQVKALCALPPNQLHADQAEIPIQILFFLIFLYIFVQVVESVNELAQIMKDLSVLVIDQVERCLSLLWSTTLSQIDSH